MDSAMKRGAIICTTCCMKRQVLWLTAKGEKEEQRIDKYIEEIAEGKLNRKQQELERLRKAKEEQIKREKEEEERGAREEEGMPK